LSGSDSERASTVSVGLSANKLKGIVVPISMSAEQSLGMPICGGAVMNDGALSNREFVN
jgi:hypothetical protein